jgi:hypothetical protein
MGVKNSSDGFKEADDVADGMIPDSQIVNMINQIASAKDVQVQQDDLTVRQPSPETTRHREADHNTEKIDIDEAPDKR